MTTLVNRSAEFFTLLLLSTCFNLSAQQTPVSKMEYTVSMDDPGNHIYQVNFKCTGLVKPTTDLKVPVWMPGYYQIMDYADNISDLTVKTPAGDMLKWEKANGNTWRIYTNNRADFEVSYKVRATRNFVAANYLDTARGFIAPTGMFMHVAGLINHPVTIVIKPFTGWDKVATGLEPVGGKSFTYFANDFDILYDSPLLIGKLESLPSFTVKGVPHYFTSYKPGNFDKESFIADLKKVIDVTVEMMGDVPFSHYTFIGIGPGAGGIEHRNSAAVSFNGDGMTAGGRIGMLSFLAHEYFHHYNAKRIRPIELGPFDYDKGSRTKMLWVAEGITAYYDEMLLRRAGLTSVEDILKTWRSTIIAFEYKPGRLFQSVTQASFDTWSDGPFGRTGDDLNKTISYYEKGPVLGLLLDFKIRHETANRKSLDDVMRTLYREYYQEKGRGYTQEEFQKVCERIAGVSLSEFFGYVSTVAEIDYKKYFAYAGLDIDTKSVAVPGAWLGLTGRERNDSLNITGVDWDSPAWLAGIRARQILKTINGQQATLKALDSLQKNQKPGDIVHLQVLQQGVLKDFSVILDTKYQKPFTIARMSKPTQLQAKIFENWSRGK